MRVEMEHDTLGNAPQPYSIPQGVNCQETVNFTPNLADDDLSGIDIRDGADVMELSTNFYMGKVPDRHQDAGILLCLLSFLMA